LVGKALADLQARGLISTGYRRVLIRGVQGLKRLVAIDREAPQRTSRMAVTFCRR
jgi:hypothetical protein